MQAQMDQIRKTQDPQERQKLLEQHWATMQSAMTIMHGMWGPGMMGHGMGPGMMGGAGPGMMGGWGHMGGYYSRLTPEQLRQRQYMTDQYLQMQQEMMRIYREEKVNPMGGCFPIMIQIPVFIALYWVLLSTVEMRDAPWILWITDLSVRDFTRTVDDAWRRTSYTALTRPRIASGVWSWISEERT